MSTRVRLSDIERKAHALLAAPAAFRATEPGTEDERIAECAWRRAEEEHRFAMTPAVALALIARIRELEMGLADALYWLKPGLDGKAAEMVGERDRLCAVLHRGDVS